MRTGPSFVVVSPEPAWLPGTRSLSRVTKDLLAALAFMLVSFGPSAYAGDGLGVATISLDTKTASGRSLTDDSDTVFAYQVGAGLGYEFPLEEGRSVTVSLDWRYFGTQTPTFTRNLTGTEFDATINGHDIGIGLIYGF